MWEGHRCAITTLYFEVVRGSLRSHTSSPWGSTHPQTPRGSTEPHLGTPRDAVDWAARLPVRPVRTPECTGISYLKGSSRPSTRTEAAV